MRLLLCTISFYLFSFPPQNKDNYSSWPVMPFIFKDKHIHIRHFSSMNTDLFNSMSLTVLAYENSTGYHDFMLYGKRVILLQVWEDIFLLMCDINKLQTSERELFSIQTQKESSIMRSWNHEFVADQNAVNIHWQSSAVGNAWWALFEPVCFCMQSWSFEVLKWWR